MSTLTPMHPSRRFPAMHTPVVAGALLVAVAACLPDGATPDVSALGAPHLIDLIDLTPITPAGDLWNDCSTWDCNKNHPELTGFPIPELNENKLPAELGMRIDSFQSVSKKKFKFDVTRGEIRGLDTEGKVALAGEALRDSELTVTNGEVLWYIKIHDYTRGLPYWVGPGSVPAYHLLYRRQGDPPSLWFNVCKQPPSPAEDPQWQGGFETFALLIDDERYDRDKITVKPDDMDAQGWFNIACAGTALAKMVLLHADPRLPQADPYHTTKAQRTATLKMLTADYFGTGQSFTQAQQPLWWISAMGWHPLEPGQNDLNPEAVWTETGARCLTTPRWLDLNPNVGNEIEAYRAAMELDPLPSCDAPAVPPAWSAGDVWHTYNAWSP